MSEYTSESIKSLEFPESIRKRPGMYIGSTGLEGLHHMLFEVVSNSVDEAMNGHATEIKVCLLYTSPSPRDRTRSRMPSSA